MAEKPESQDICFATGRAMEPFAAGRVAGIRTGPILDMNGKVLGEHKGIVHYTIGQRGGLGISSRTPLYVCAPSTSVRESNNFVGGRKDLKVTGLVAGDLNIPLLALARRRLSQRSATEGIPMFDFPTGT